MSFSDKTHSALFDTHTVPAIAGFVGILAIFGLGLSQTMLSGDNFYVSTSCIALIVVCVGLWPVRKVF